MMFSIFPQPLCGWGEFDAPRPKKMRIVCRVYFGNETSIIHGAYFSLPTQSVGRNEEKEKKEINLNEVKLC